MQLENNRNYYATWAKGNALYAKAANMMGIGYPEMVVIYSLKVCGKQTQKEISTACGLLKPTVNTVIRDMKQRGLIVLVQGDTDKRERIVALTEEGERYCGRLLDPILKIENNVFKILGEERLAKMQELMELYNTLLEMEVKKEWEK